MSQTRISTKYMLQVLGKLTRTLVNPKSSAEDAVTVIEVQALYARRLLKSDTFSQGEVAHVLRTARDIYRSFGYSEVEMDLAFISPDGYTPQESLEDFFRRFTTGPGVYPSFPLYKNPIMLPRMM